MAIDALTWGKPILEKVERESSAWTSTGGAKMAQSVTADRTAFLRCPTPINQALIGGVAGAGAARGLNE
ncbi:MAG: hypothetical protein HPY84_10320 [Syntrophobacteraceae bacterium]|nr:hypothetical protein [Syntrophobacteraceae bacterium]